MYWVYEFARLLRVWVLAQRPLAEITDEDIEWARTSLKEIDERELHFVERS